MAQIHPGLCIRTSALLYRNLPILTMAKKFKKWDIIRDKESGDHYLITERVSSNKSLSVDTLNLDKGWFIHNYLYDWETEEPKFDKVNKKALSEEANARREYYIQHDNLVNFKSNGK